MKRQPLNPHLRLKTDYSPKVDVRLCDHPECKRQGEYKAPKNTKARHNHPEDYYHFCLDHVQAYNNAWNFCEGMSQEEIERQMYRDLMWDQPSWPFSSGSDRDGKRAFQYNAEFLYQNSWQKFVDSMNGFRFGEDYVHPEDRKKYDKARKALGEEEAALALFGLTRDDSPDVLKKRYKILVKKYHPDLYGGDKEKEEFFKKINEAYQLLKKMLEKFS